MNFKQFFNKHEEQQLVPYKKVLPKIFYHATKKYKLDSILQNGLFPRKELDPSNWNYVNSNLPSGVYLTDTQENALKIIRDSEELAAVNRKGDLIQVIQIDSSFLDSSKVYMDPNYDWKYNPSGYFPAWLYQGRIPPQALTI